MQSKNDFKWSRAYAEISLNAILKNFDALSARLLPGVKKMAVVKANAYGHGAVEISKAIDENTDFFAVSNIDEAIQIRNGGINKPILILGYTPPRSMDLIAEHDVTQTVFSYEYGKMLAEAAESLNKKIKVHIKIDTGMNRLGFSVQNEEEKKASIVKIKELSKERFLEFEGIFTHFAVADEPEDPFTKTQFDRFTDCVTQRCHSIHICIDLVVGVA